MSHPELIYQSSKTYNHSQGLSCVFRQWRAESHCHLLHGYALKVELVFQAKLDARNWVVDFGDLKEVKQFLAGTFDHKMVVAEDDPELETFRDLHTRGLIDLVVIPAVGCEKFAEYIFLKITELLPEIGEKLESVQVWEHEANSAKVIRAWWNHSKKRYIFEDLYEQVPVFDSPNPNGKDEDRG